MRVCSFTTFIILIGIWGSVGNIGVMEKKKRGIYWGHLEVFPISGGRSAAMSVDPRLVKVIIVIIAILVVILISAKFVIIVIIVVLVFVVIIVMIVIRVIHVVVVVVLGGARLVDCPLQRNSYRDDGISGLCGLGDVSFCPLDRAEYLVGV